METEMRRSWALLIGIDTYPRFESRRQLEGCVNDVQIMKDALVRRFGFQEERIRVLTNLEATQDAILAAFEDLVQRVGENESVIVHYSGHGSQKPDGPEDDEPDGWDWLQRLVARNSPTTLIFDCCHSGRDLPRQKDPRLAARG